MLNKVQIQKDKKYKKIKFNEYDTNEETPCLKINLHLLYKELIEIKNLYTYIVDESTTYYENQILYTVIDMDEPNFKETIMNIWELNNKYNMGSISSIVINQSEFDDIQRNEYYYYVPILDDIISYDFDGVLHKSMIPNTIHPIDFDSWNEWIPNMEIIRNLKEESQKGSNIIVVTSRCMFDIPTIWSFINKWSIPVCEVYTTESDYVKKSYILKNLNASKHYDDNPNIQDDVNNNGIEFILVKNK